MGHPHLENAQCGKDDKSAFKACGEIFDLAMTIRMVLIRRHGCKDDASQGKGVATTLIMDSRASERTAEELVF